MAEHNISFVAMGGGRQGWECSCGQGGSVGEFGDVEIAAEKHVGSDESVAYVRQSDG